MTTHTSVLENVFCSGFDLNEIIWETWEQPGRESVERHVLWAPNEATGEDSTGLLLRFPPGAHGDYHEHLGYELMLVLDGQLDHSNGRYFTKGSLVLESPGTTHQMSSSQGCTVLAIRTAPAEQQPDSSKP